MTFTPTRLIQFIYLEKNQDVSSFFIIFIIEFIYLDDWNRVMSAADDVQMVEYYGTAIVKHVFQAFYPTYYHTSTIFSSIEYRA